MQENDLKSRVYKYYDLLRKELTGTTVAAKVNGNGEHKGVSIDVKRPRPKSKTIKWRSKGY